MQFSSLEAQPRTNVIGRKAHVVAGEQSIVVQLSQAGRAALGR
jgi:hypothetical protein